MVRLKPLFLLVILIFLHFVLHLYSTRGSNFYFTVDQGRDALEVREILVRHKFPQMGPRTGAIENLFVGPFWYFIIAPGYFLFKGNPWGAVWVMVFLNAFFIVWVFWFSRKYIFLTYSFLLTLGLIVFENFWFASQFSLNPHLLPLLTSGAVFSLIFVAEGKKYWLIPQAFFTGLTVHSELAFVPVAFLTFFLSSIYFLKLGKVTLKIVLISYFTLFLFLLPHLFYEVSSDFSQTKAVVRQLYEPTGIIGKTSLRERFNLISSEFSKLFGKAILPQNPLLGFLTLLFSMILITLRLLRKKLDKSLALFFKLTMLMVIFSFLWFIQTKEFLPWHMLGMYSLVYIVVMLCLASLHTHLTTIVFSLILLSQIANFVKTYSSQTKPTIDHGLFINQLNAVDWIYKEADNKGFRVYSYLQYVYDYPYQYTIWWRGTNKYGYLPCEYSTYPSTPSSLYFSGIDYFQQPKKPCTSLTFMIIEPTTDQSGFNKWYQGITKNTSLVKKANFGSLIVEQRLKFGDGPSIDD